MIWRRIGDAMWLTLFAAFGAWYVGWAFGYEPWRWNSRLLLGVAAAFGAFEVAVLANKTSRDTLSERMRLMARARTLIPLACGVVGGAGIAVAAWWPLEAPQVRALRVFGFVAVLAPLSGHFYRPRSPLRALARMDHALFAGGAYGWLCAMAACAGLGPVAFAGVLLIAAIIGVLLGGEFFALSD